MFDDFRRDETRQRKRFAGSMVVAAALYAGASAALIAASAEARQRVEEVLTQVEFVRPRPPAPPPPQPPPQVVEVPTPEPPKPVARKPRAKRVPLVAPEQIPTEKPEESDRELAEAAPPSALEGSLDGVPGGTGSAGAGPAVPQAAPQPVAVRPAPPPKPKVVPVEKLIAPIALKTDRPKYPARLRRRGIEGAVVVSFEVLHDGKVANPRILSGPPEFHETVLETIVTWRFQPARRGAQSVRHRVQHTIRFRLQDS